MAPRKPRLFIGIELDDETRQRCAAVSERLRASSPNLRLVEPENYHLTLAFLGNVKAEWMAEIERALDATASRHRQFPVTLNRLGAFPHERKPRVIFVGSRGADPAYRALAAGVSAECKRLAFQVEDKDDIPHVTLARVPERARLSLPLLDVERIVVDVAALTLFESIPHEGHTRYEARHVSPLG
ncbi:MAG TPA: RNA 2',3'-cyclic phosphodiesterase [Candidatus Tyrphobacter sp.]